ncbi:MAG TPA: phage holin family protein [Patescibacteria group bacterium]|nr:phage holin family protein [Patescibacteria group bacterium]
MKKLLRHFVIDTLSLFYISTLASGMVFGNGPKTLILAGISVSIVSIIGRPVINLMLLPLNLVTFGLFRWVASSIVLYISTLIVPAFKIQSFLYSGLSTKWLEIPQLSFSGIWAFVAFSFLLSVVTSLIYWLVK